ncbi:hypothetical protein HOY80DRAFT_1134114 [Tuber brumale]|nr:hypothetical protein HOY80DRAFT_1134114 [Tuber brumale]
MFTHFGQHRKLVCSSIKVPSCGASISYVEHQEQLSKLEATWYKRFVQQGEEKDKQLKEEREEKDKKLKEEREEKDKHLEKVLGEKDEHLEKVLGEKDKQLKEEREEKDKRLEKVLGEKDRQLKEERDEAETKREQIQQRSEKLKCKLLLAETERMKLEQNFNVRGALERIVFQARLKEKIEPEGGTQKGLNELAKGEDLVKVLETVVQKRRVVRKDVEACFPHLYHRVSVHAHGNNGTIVIRAADFPPNERAALVVLLELQNQWSFPLDWKVEEEDQKDKE